MTDIPEDAAELIKRVATAIFEADIILTARSHPELTVDHVRKLALKCAGHYSVMAQAAIDTIDIPALLLSERSRQIERDAKIAEHESDVLASYGAWQCASAAIAVSRAISAQRGSK